MELTVSSPKPGGLSPDSVSDPDIKEISDEDDDDRNHKHRRRDTRSQSLEGDASEQVLSRPFRKRHKPNMRSEDQAEKRGPSLPTFSRGPSDLNQRIRVNQSFAGDPGLGRGRGRNPRFNSTGIASQMVHQGSLPPSLFGGRGLTTGPNEQRGSWGTFGLVPNGGLDTLPSLGLRGALRPTINPSLIGIPRQRCRDFEERGFCLRGDMCPMEHGFNRIVVEDVQSLSQFNLPVSLPSAHILGNAAGPGPLPSHSAPSSTVMNNGGIHNKSSKPGLAEDGFSLNGAFSGSAGGGGADLYDPDQPLWNNDRPKTTELLAHQGESLLDADPSERHLGIGGSTENDHPIGSTGSTVASHGTSLRQWGRIGGSKSRVEIKKKTDSTTSSLDQPVNETMADQEAVAIDFSSRAQANAIRNIRRPSQKALRTLFVSGIPQQNNRIDALLSHFRKFGEIIDIYIPSNSERAFVQFSKRGEAEAALMAPDAVMGNRFIKLWWANRDRIPEESIRSGNSASVTPCGVSPRLSVANATKDSAQPAAPKFSVAHSSDLPPPASGHSKSVNSNSPKALPPLHKKLENLELLKEELRKKQEMLDQKRNAFRQQLNKLEKVTGSKGEVVSENDAKKQKVEQMADFTEDAAQTSTDAGVLVASAQAEMMLDERKSGETVVSQSPKTGPTMTLQEPTNPKPQIRPSPPVGTRFLTNRFKLDNRPTAFRIVPPLPAGFANVSALKEHFSSYGGLSSVDLEGSESQDSGNDLDTPKSCSAVINFATRRSAEGAFVNGKCWQGHNLEFVWLTCSSAANNENVGKEKSPSAPKVHSDAGVEPLEKLECRVSKEAPLTENGEAGSSDRTKGSVEHMEEEFKPCSTPISCEEQMPEDKIC